MTWRLYPVQFGFRVPGDYSSVGASGFARGELICPQIVDARGYGQVPRSIVTGVPLESSVGRDQVCILVSDRGISDRRRPGRHRGRFPPAVRLLGVGQERGDGEAQSMDRLRGRLGRLSLV